MTETGELKKLSFADSILIVLNEPQQNLNIGSVARAMMNLGFSNLVLVNPYNFDLEKTRITARWAQGIVEKAVVVDSLREAIIDCSDVIGFGGRYDGPQFDQITVPQWIKDFKPQIHNRIALVFGSEDRGLNTEEINLCRCLVRIPSTSDYSSYNLAQSVLLALYELSRTEWDQNITTQTQREMPTQNDFFQLDRLLEESLTISGFYRKGTPAPIPGTIQKLFHRMNPDKREIGILLAMINRLNTTLKRHKDD